MGEVLAIFVACYVAYGLTLELLILHVYTPDSGYGCEGSSEGQRRVSFMTEIVFSLNYVRNCTTDPFAAKLWYIPLMSLS